MNTERTELSTIYPQRGPWRNPGVLLIPDLNIKKFVTLITRDDKTKSTFIQLFWYVYEHFCYIYKRGGREKLP
jgi:hypothetical protein